MSRRLHYEKRDLTPAELRRIFAMMDSGCGLKLIAQRLDLPFEVVRLAAKSIREKPSTG